MEAPFRQPATENLNLCYLVSSYPSYSHTFILREIVKLRELGARISTCSINPSEIKEPSAGIQREIDATFVIKKAGVWNFFAALGFAVWNRPRTFFSGFFRALSKGGWDLKKTLFHMFYFGEACLLGHWMWKKGVQHVHVHFANPAASVALFASWVFPITFSMTVHGPDVFSAVETNLLQEKVSSARFVVAISRFTLSQIFFHTKEWQKCHCMYLGVDTKLFSPRSAPKNETLRLLCVARLSPAKGHGILFKALEMLLDRGVPFSLELIGDGPLREELQEKCKALSSHVHFRGALLEDAVRKAIAKADVFVLPSFAEGLPISLMEAMACQVPCVTTWYGGIPELIESGVSGILVPPADPDALACAIQRLRFLDERRRMGERARERVLEKFDLEENVLRLRDLFHQELS